ncbi:MAG: hypothetical protein HQ596_04635 [Candidatus Saganbacteria bacterium]|nr:hypothetical protein [Candidatus Saganbacteria bacterium]
MVDGMQGVGNSGNGRCSSSWPVQFCVGPEALIGRAVRSVKPSGKKGETYSEIWAEDMEMGEGRQVTLGLQKIQIRNRVFQSLDLRIREGEEIYTVHIGDRGRSFSSTGISNGRQLAIECLKRAAEQGEALGFSDGQQNTLDIIVGTLRQTNSDI